MKNEEILKLIEKEGDKKEFTYRGHDCQILRDPDLGHLCGYVKKQKDLLYTDGLLCHCGVTYNSETLIGFDCGHQNDLKPFLFKIINLMDKHAIPTAAMKRLDLGTYRDMEYVEKILQNMVEQIIELNTNKKSLE